MNNLAVLINCLKEISDLKENSQNKNFKIKITEELLKFINRLIEKDPSSLFSLQVGYYDVNNS